MSDDGSGRSGLRGVRAMSQPIRPTQAIADLQERNQVLTRRLHDLEQRLDKVDWLQETVDDLRDGIEQLQAVWECGNTPAPVFLRWKPGVEDGCPVVRATFGKYRLEVVDGRSAISWSIQEGSKWAAAGGGCIRHIESAMDEAEEALRRVIQEKQMAAQAKAANP